MNEFSMVVLDGIPDDDTRAVIIVPPEYFEKTYELLNVIYDRYYDSDDENYYYWGWGDYIEDELDKANIPHSTIHREDFAYTFRSKWTYPKMHYVEENSDGTGSFLYFDYLRFLRKHAVQTNDEYLPAFDKDYLND